MTDTAGGDAPDLPDSPQRAAGPLPPASPPRPRRTTSEAGEHFVISLLASSLPKAGFSHGSKSIAQPQAEVTRAETGKIEVSCPAELVLNTTFFKRSGTPPATVLYRYRFVHGPVSTVFSRLVDQDGPNHVSHPVPIPLPPPIRPGGPGGGGPPPTVAPNLAVYFDPGDVVPGGGNQPPAAGEPQFTAEALPGNEHKSSVRVEVLNAFEGVVSSAWMTYHMVCIPSSDRPFLGPGEIGASVSSLQVAINRWLRVQNQRVLRVDGVFGSRTENAVKLFQRTNGLRVDGIVGRRTWHSLLRPQRASGNHVGACEPLL